MQGKAEKLVTARTGSVLVVVVVMVAALTAVCGALLGVAKATSKRVDATADELMAQSAAEAGIERALRELKIRQVKASLADPFSGMLPLAGQTLFSDEPIKSIQDPSRELGRYTVTVTNVTQVDELTCNVTIQSVGGYPDTTSPESTKKTVTAVARVALGSSDLFAYAYFINNWGWFYGDTIVANGNVRSNGQFDAGGYSPIINGQPRFQRIDGTDLQGYIDDNGDGITDGSDGGIYAAWAIKGTQNVRGMGGLSKNQHEFVDPIPMPNLTDLSLYEQLAREKGGTISIGGQVVVDDGVVGDDPGEPPCLYLEGTVDNPIVINGPVVVRKDVIISGYVTGQGVIYAGRNVYVPKNLYYKNPPTTPRPASTSEADMEAWLQENQNKDFLGLFAREHIAWGDYTDSYWQYYVGNWLNDPDNESEEDCGEDQIPNTKPGRDGITGTADDDVLEGDGVWTVDRYTQADADLGLIPPGKSVGDPIPGTGEDTDGDGQYDPRTQVSDFEITDVLDDQHWVGNFPSSSPISYSDIATTNITHIDAAFYTNHALGAFTLARTEDFIINGCIVSRNESIVYGTKTLTINHDLRLLGAGRSLLPNLVLPLNWQPIRLLAWRME